MTDHRSLLFTAMFAFLAGGLVGHIAVARAKCGQDSLFDGLVLVEDRGTFPAAGQGSLRARDFGDTFEIEVSLSSDDTGTLTPGIVSDGYPEVGR